MRIRCTLRTMPARQRWARWLLWTALALAGAVGLGSRLADDLPSPPAHATVAPSVLYDRYGTPIAEIGPSVAHASLGLEDMAPALVDAMVAVLDPNFLKRDGVDAETYAAGFRRLGQPPGARNEGIMRRYLDSAHHLDSGALSEARLLLAELRLSRELSRPEILERFVNSVYLGRGAYGVQAAAIAWYGIAASELTVTQAAYLASLVNAPWGVDVPSGPPDDPFGPTRADRDRVLLAMFEHDMLTPNELAAGRSQALVADIRPMADLAGVATESDVVQPGGSDGAAAGFVRMLVDDIGLSAGVGRVYVQLVERYGVARVVTGGLHVTTSLDVPAQRFALEAVRAGVGVAATSSAAVDMAVLDRSGDVRVLLSEKGSNVTGDSAAVTNGSGAGGSSSGDFSSGLRTRPLGDLLGPAKNALGSPLAQGDHNSLSFNTSNSANNAGSADSSGSPAQLADVARVAAAFSVAATGGQERTSRIVLEVASVPPSRTPANRDAHQWPMRVAVVDEEAAIAEMRDSMSSLELRSGVAALGRANSSRATGDTWFAGWTSHYTAAVLMSAAQANAGADAGADAGVSDPSLVDAGLADTGSAIGVDATPVAVLFIDVLDYLHTMP